MLHAAIHLERRCHVHVDLHQITVAMKIIALCVIMVENYCVVIHVLKFSI